MDIVKMTEIEIINTLSRSFAKDEIKRQVLDPYWLQKNIENGIHSTGFCFSASEVLYRMTGGKNVWKFCSINDPKHWNNGTHYFLRRKSNNEIVDITSDQYTLRGIEIPHEKGRAGGMRNVSIKARTLANLSGLGKI